MPWYRRLSDYLLSRSTRISWRRLAAWSAGTALLLSGHLTGDQWVTVTAIFVAGEAAEAALGRLRGAAPGAGEGL